MVFRYSCVSSVSWVLKKRKILNWHFHPYGILNLFFIPNSKDLLFEQVHTVQFKFK